MNIGRGHYNHRLAIVVDSSQALADGLAEIESIVGGESTLPGAFYGRHDMVSAKKRDRAPGELDDAAKAALTERATQVLAQCAQSNDSANALDKLAELYVTGATVDWQQFYRGEERRRIALPTYPLQRIRVWAEPKRSELAVAEQFIHPLVQREVSRDSSQIVYESVLSPARHWVLSDHKIKGVCVVPGTTYLEMIRAAVEHARGWSSIEFSQVFFIVPLAVAEEQSRTVRIRLLDAGAASKAGQLKFVVDSRENEHDWVQHAEGLVSSCELAVESIALDTLSASATETIAQYEAENGHWGIPVRPPLERYSIGVAHW